MKQTTALFGRRTRTFLISIVVFAATIGVAGAHPLGNFTINHFSRLTVGRDRLAIHYVIDMAEIPSLQEFGKIDSDSDGVASEGELKQYAQTLADRFARGLTVNFDDEALSPRVANADAILSAGAGGLPTLRLQYDLAAYLPNIDARESHRVFFEDSNFSERLGWREVVVTQASGISVFDTAAYSDGISDELTRYPEERLTAPLNERTASFSMINGSRPQGSSGLHTRDGRPAEQTRDRFAELIAVRELTPSIALAGLLIAMILGAAHALSPGHGKTVVGAYLVGSRGTARHAAFLGATVTITHTAGIFALGLITLFASRYVLPEQIFPIMSVVSGAIVLAIGSSLFIKRLRVAFGWPPLDHHRHHHEHHDHDELVSHSHDHEHHHLEHAHSNGSPHSHLPPGADGSAVTWRSLLALGISGGLLPCPSALVVMLSAISLHRVGYGLLLVIAFSIGLAGTLTAVGLMFVFVKRLVKPNRLSGRLIRVLPVASAFVIACAGAAICYESITTAGASLLEPFARLGQFLNAGPAAARGVSAVSLLGLGLLFGLRHAIEADHVAAVSTIVSERKSWRSSSLVGGLWGVGHTISLLIAGIAVLVLNLKIGEKAALGLEFCVALMLMGLGANSIRKTFRNSGAVSHQHVRSASGQLHSHSESGSPHRHHGLQAGTGLRPRGVMQFGARPLLVGMMHGLAGSAGLMLLVLSTVSSSAMGLAFIAVFGIGSIGGMLMMSALLGLPLQLTAQRFNRAHRAVQFMAALFSLAIGVMMAIQIGIADRLFF